MGASAVAAVARTAGRGVEGGACGDQDQDCVSAAIVALGELYTADMAGGDAGAGGSRLGYLERCFLQLTRSMIKLQLGEVRGGGGPGV